jgi:hypothetical protein
MNYFNYFTEIEDVFIRRRGKHLWLSPMDWALMESWKEKGVPLHVALRGVERAFDSFDAKPHRHRSVKSLMYCQEEVEAQYAEWLDAQIGASHDAGHVNGDHKALEEETVAQDAALPFTCAHIIQHLAHTRLSLSHLSEERNNAINDDFCEALKRASVRLEEIERGFSSSTCLEVEKLEDSLTSLETLLDDALLKSFPSAQFESIRREVAAQLEPYRLRMNRETYEQTFDNLLMKRLREMAQVPRLSLFYL